MAMPILSLMVTSKPKRGKIRSCAEVFIIKPITMLAIDSIKLCIFVCTAYTIITL